MANIAPHVVAMFAHLPQPIRIDADLPADLSTAPEAALQLLKLSLGCDRVRIGEVRVGASAAQVVATLGERSCTLTAGELQRDLRSVARHVLSSLFAGSDVARVLEDFAFQTSSLVTLQRITSHMLQTTDLDRALYVMLSGVTAGYGLSFNRAALFVFDDARGVFVGQKAIGPADEQEAHRIWEAIELEEKSLDQMIDDSSEHRVDTRFQQQVEKLETRAMPGDELSAALAAPGAMTFTGAPVNPVLAALDATCGFVLAAIRGHGHLRGLLFADNRYTHMPVSAEQLAHVGFYTDQTALVWENLSLLARVETAAREDALTGVFNRRELDARFEAERSRCQRSGASCSVLLIDVDRFKSINDTAGHAAGDDLLRTLGVLLRRHLREHDVAARLGGDEFAVLLPEASAEHVVAAAHRLGSLAREAGISLSIGGATWPHDTVEMASLFGAADAQLYAAKHAGRGCAFVRGRRIDY